MASCCFISVDKNKPGLSKLLQKEPCQLKVVTDVGDAKTRLPLCRWHFYLHKRMREYLQKKAREPEFLRYLRECEAHQALLAVSHEEIARVSNTKKAKAKVRRNE